jgi:hypothetical protein
MNNGDGNGDGNNGDPNKYEHWRELCQKAAVEPDDGELIKLVDEINQTLDKKFDRSGGKTSD